MNRATCEHPVTDAEGNVFLCGEPCLRGACYCLRHYVRVCFAKPGKALDE